MFSEINTFNQLAILKKFTFVSKPGPKNSSCSLGFDAIIKIESTVSAVSIYRFALISTR